MVVQGTPPSLSLQTADCRASPGLSFLLGQNSKETSDLISWAAQARGWVLMMESVQALAVDVKDLMLAPSQDEQVPARAVMDCTVCSMQTSCQTLLVCQMRALILQMD